MFKYLTSWIAVFATASVAWAEELSDSAGASAGASTGATLANSSTTWLSVLFSLLMVIGSIFAIGWIYKRLQNGGLVNGQGVNVLSVTPLGQREKLVVAEVAGQTLLLGVTQHNINLLTQLDGDSLTSEAPGGQSSDFSKKLSALLASQKSEV